MKLKHIKMTKSRNKTYWTHCGIKMSITSKKLKNEPKCCRCGEKPSKVEMKRMERELDIIYKGRLCNNLNLKK